MKLPEAVLPASSVAEQFTVVWPKENVDPEFGVQVTAGCRGFVSSAVTLYVAVAPLGPVASAVISAGKLRVDGALSTLTEAWLELI